MKKIFSTLIASIMSVSVLTAVSVSAASATDVDALAVSTETVATATTVDGTSIPAGTVAITVSVSNNSGFSTSSVKLDLGSAYDVVLDSEGKPVVSAGTALGESLIGSYNKEDIVVITSASVDENTVNGEMFTFYAYTDEASSDNSIIILDSEMDETTLSDASGISTCSNMDGFYICGDINGDGVITAVDAANILSALDLINRTELHYLLASLNPQYYFPGIISPKAAYIWTLDFSDIYAVPPVTNETSQEILDYYACQQADEPYTGTSYIGFSLPV